MRLTAGLAVLSVFHPITDEGGAVFAAPENSEPGQAGVSPGAPGMADDESLYLNDLRLARAKGIPRGHSEKATIGALTALGLHYNRKEQPAKAIKALSAALKLTAQDDYENLEQILPPLVEAETNHKDLHPAEIHVKRLIELARANHIHQFPQLMFALNQYSRILTLSHRTAEATRIKAEADKINSNIKGL